MSFLIDSNIIVAKMEDDAAAERVFGSLVGAEKFISVINYMKILHGAIKQGPRAIDQFTQLLRHLELLDVSRDVAHRCAHLRVQLDRPNRRVRARTLDLLIASTALEYGLTVVTNNVRDFADIPNLKVFQPLDAD